MKSKLLRYAAPPAAVAFGLAACGSSPNKVPLPEATPTIVCAPAWVQTIGERILALPDAWHGGHSDTQGVTMNGGGGSVTISVESAPPTPDSSLGAAVNLCLINQVVISGTDTQGNFYAGFDEGNINDNSSDDSNAWQPNAGEASCSDQHGVALAEKNEETATGLSQSNQVAAKAVIHATASVINEVVGLAQAHDVNVSQLLASSCGNLG